MYYYGVMSFLDKTWKEVLAGLVGFEPTANGLRGHRSGLAELQTHTLYSILRALIKMFHRNETTINIINWYRI